MKENTEKGTSDETEKKSELRSGALRSSLAVELHTRYAILLWEGQHTEKKEKDGRKVSHRRIMGMPYFLHLVNRINEDSLKDDPFADEKMYLLEQEFNRGTGRLERLVTELDNILKNVPARISLSEALSVSPVNISVFSRTPVGYRCVWLLVGFDQLALKAFQASHYGLISHAQRDDYLRRGAQSIHRSYGLVLGYRSSGISRRDILQNSSALPAQTVLDIAQKLYETHKLTSYPRTDCGYLPVSMREEIPQVLSAVVGTDPALQPVVAQLDTQFVSRIWNDKKITAHHGIIPTKHTGDLSKLSDEERNVYQLVRLHYLAQFMPLMEVDATEATFNIGGQLFRTRGNVVVKAGWKSLFGKMADDDEKGDEAVLPAMQAGQVCQVQGAEQKAQQTKPPAPYNDGTLIAAMTNAAAFVTDAALKKVLKENAGIGTEATRAGIIDTLVKRGFLVREKKALRSTPLGRSLVDVLPGTLTNPGLTALWEQMLDEVAAGKVSLDDFMAKQSQWVSQLVAQGKSQPLAMQVPPSPLCPVCGGKTSQRKGKNGSFWGCLNYPDCKGIVGDGGNAKTLQGQGRSSLPTRLKIKLR